MMVLIEYDLKKQLVELSLRTGEPMSNIVSDALKEHLARSGNLIIRSESGG